MWRCKFHQNLCSGLLLITIVALFVIASPSIGEEPASDSCPNCLAPVPVLPESAEQAKGDEVTSRTTHVIVFSASGEVLRRTIRVEVLSPSGEVLKVQEFDVPEFEIREPAAQEEQIQMQVGDPAEGTPAPLEPNVEVQG